MPSIDEVRNPIQASLINDDDEEGEEYEEAEEGVDEDDPLDKERLGFCCYLWAWTVRLCLLVGCCLQTTLKKLCSFHFVRQIILIQQV
jgi:hypothetical protein